MTLENELRDTLTDGRRALPAWLDAADRVRAGMRRRRRRRVSLATAAAVVLAVAGLPTLLLDHSRAPATPGFTVHPAPLSLDPSPYWQDPVPTTTGTHDCTVADFAGQATSTGNGTSHVVITLTDRGSAPCQLVEPPVLVTVDTAHTAHTVPVDFTEHTNLLPPPVQPGQAVHLVVETCAGAQPAVYNQLALAFGDGGRVPVPNLTLTSTCVVRVGDWHTNP